ncbi:MAG: hypothetical protein II486_12290 [Thermoguttaceae bacterium]|nr:hypothetical protein [Thermoguttaceae bacterium]
MSAKSSASNIPELLAAVALQRQSFEFYISAFCLRLKEPRPIFNRSADKKKRKAFYPKAGKTPSG